MSDDNDVTLSSYDNHIQEYVDGTPQQVDGGREEWLESLLSKLPESSEILELGSGFGRDADFIEQKGFKVIRTDGSKGFVELLRKQGHEAHYLNALTDSFGNDRTMIFANAVLLHFKPEEMEDILNRVYSSLSFGGILAFTLKEGDGEAWTDEKLGAPRYFCYWRAPQIRQLLLKTGFKDITISTEKGKSANWLKIAAFR